MSDLKKTIFDFLDDNQDVLKKENCNEILFKKFYPNAKEFEKEQKKKYISKVKNEYIKKFSDDLKEVETVPIKLGEVPEPVKNIPGELDLQVIKNVVSDKIKENLILSISQQEKLLELLNTPQHPIKEITVPAITGEGEKERYNIRILISAMDKLKEFAKKNNSNASAVIEYLINTHL